MGKPVRRNVKAGLSRLALRISVRFDYVLFPIDMREFVNRVASLQYAPLGELPPEPPASGPEASLVGQGPVARKGNLTVDINTEKQFIGISGQSEAIETFGQLSSILAAHKDILDPLQIAFFEMQARYRTRAPSSPLAAMARLGKNSRVTKEATQALGLPVDLFSVRLIAAPRGPNSTDYLEVWLQPIASLPTKDLGISVIFRDSDRAKFEATSTQLENRLVKLLESAFPETHG